MRLHVLSLPHTQPTRAFDHCAYTAKVRKFTSMMYDLGYPVTLYAGGKCEARCSEFVSCIEPDEQDFLLSGEEWWQKGEVFGLKYNEHDPIWRLYHERAIEAIRDRIESHDIICMASGTNSPVMEAFPNHMCVETGVGYQGTVASYRVFESYAWMHMVYGHQQTAAGADGRFYDAVIPNFFEADEYPLGDGGGDYLVYMSRMTHRKGYQIAIDAAEVVGLPLLVAGVGGDRPQHDHVEYVGVVHGKEKARLLGGARAVLVPTLYVEPFGGVAVEAMMCGTPAITTDWGAFTETVDSRWRCRTLAEFAKAIKRAGESVDRELIRTEAVRRFSTAFVGEQYQAYFERLQGLWGDGFYASV